MSLWKSPEPSARYFHASNVYSIADRRARLCDGQAARLPQSTRQGAGVESGEIATRDADTHKGSGVPLNVEGERTVPPPLPSSLVATIAGCPAIRIDGRTTYLLGTVGIAFKDAIGWRWAAHIGAPPHDIWNVAFTEALEARANQ